MVGDTDGVVIGGRVFMIVGIDGVIMGGRVFIIVGLDSGSFPVTARALMADGPKPEIHWQLQL